MGSATLALLLLLLFMGLFLAVGWIFTTKFTYPKSPYTGLPLRSADSLPFETKKRVYSYLKTFGGYENRPFRFNKAAFCRETGMIFPDCISWRGKMHVDWMFLLKRQKGNWISWGSLSEELRRKVKARHTKIDGFQTECSSSEPSPTRVESVFVYTKPGPLYVDINEMVLMGWKVVPETFVEVLIVQKPDR